MGIPKVLNFTSYNKYSTDTNPTTDADMQTYMTNQNLILTALASMVWQPQTQYVAGKIITSNSMAGNVVAVVTTAGKSGTTEPTWKTSGTVTDGTVTYTMRSILTQHQDISGKADVSALASYLPLAGGTVTGTLKAPTPSTSDSSTKVATTAYVKNQGYVKSINGSTPDSSGNVTLPQAIKLRMW